MVLSTIPDLYGSQDANRLAMCKSIIQAAEITNSALSRTFSPNDGKQLGENLKVYREHLKIHWPNVSIKPNLHLAQHLPHIATLFGPPTYTASWAGERMNGILIKIPKNRHIGELLNLVRETISVLKLYRVPSQRIWTRQCALLSFVEAFSKS
jgi:hypothetical protein